MKRYTFLFLFLVILQSALARKNDYDIYLMIGQSNMAGRGLFESNDTINAYDGVYLLNDRGKIEPALAPLNKYSNIRKSMDMQMFGPADGFGERMHKLTGRKILLVVNAKGGSSIKSWQPGIKDSFADASIARAKQALKYGELKGIIWHQGESDVNMDADEYAQRFSAMTSAIRAELNAPGAPVVVGQIGEWRWGDTLAIKNFNEVTLKKTLERTPNSYEVFSYKLERKYADNESDPHFNRASAKELGYRYAEAILPHVCGTFITQFRDNKKSAISFTYDDGMLCHYTDVAPQLEKRGFRGTFWLIGSNMDKDDKGYPWMSWKQVADLSKRGHEISNHTWTHPHMSKLNKDDLVKEIFECDSAIEKVTGKRPITFCYPYNEMTPLVIRVASANRVGTRTFWDSHGEDDTHCTPAMLTEWLKRTIETGIWSVTMSHGTTYGWDMWYHPEWLWNLYDEVKAAESDVWVGTFAEVSAYKEERLNCLLDVSRSSSSLRVAPTLNLDQRLFKEDLTLRINGNFAGKDVTAIQDGKKLEVTNMGEYILFDFNPSGKPIHIKY